MFAYRNILCVLQMGGLRSFSRYSVLLHGQFGLTDDHPVLSHADSLPTKRVVDFERALWATVLNNLNFWYALRFLSTLSEAHWNFLMNAFKSDVGNIKPCLLYKDGSVRIFPFSECDVTTSLPTLLPQTSSPRTSPAALSVRRASATPPRLVFDFCAADDLFPVVSRDSAAAYIYQKSSD